MRRAMAAIMAAWLTAAPAMAQLAAAPDARPADGATPPVDYADPAHWMCRPGVDDGTCSANLGAMAIDAQGGRAPAPWAAAADPPVDCFYVYPTTSLDPTFYSDLVPDAEEKRAVHGQLARIGARCRLFAPVYHQLTMTALRWGMTHPGGAKTLSFDIPYRDILAAWRAYLAHDNKGRGVVLVGHSQGAMLLKRLIAEEIDGRPAQKLLVAAYLAGNPDLDQASFRSVPPCRAADQTGCVVAWSTYVDTTTAGPRFFGHAGTGHAPLCVNPAAIGGARGRCRPI